MALDQLRTGVTLPFDPSLTVPPLHEVAIDVPAPDPVPDVEAATRQSVTTTFAGTVVHGMSVAVGAGSRGLTGRVELLRGAISGLRELGAEPFVVPAMGSHGGATADGQRAMLAHLGITPASVGAEIRSTMDTVVLGDDGERDGGASRPQRRRCRRDLPREPGEAAHQLPRPDRERPDEDGRGRIRQAAGSGPGALVRSRSRCATASSTASRCSAAPGACSVASPRWSRQRVRSSQSARSTRRTWAAPARSS